MSMPILRMVRIEDRDEARIPSEKPNTEIRVRFFFSNGKTPNWSLSQSSIKSAKIP
jgi:hypothetical protein